MLLASLGYRPGPNGTGCLIIEYEELSHMLKMIHITTEYLSGICKYDYLVSLPLTAFSNILYLPY
jgi:hypothetical protein